MLGKKLAVDLGSANTRVCIRGENTQIVEPTVIVRNAAGSAMGMGSAALAAAAEDEILTPVWPLSGTTFTDHDAIGSLLHQLINRMAGRQRIFRPDIVIALTSAIGDDDRRFILDICAKAGVRTSYLVNPTLAAALGAGSFEAADTRIVVCIGAGVVEVACVTGEGTVASSTSAQAGSAIRDGVIQRVREIREVDIEKETAEKLISSLLCVKVMEERRMTVSGHADGESRSVTLASTDFADLVAAHVERVAAEIDAVLSDVPPELNSAVRGSGVLLAGGGARLEGLDRALAQHLDLKVRPARDPEFCVLRGTAVAAENLDLLRRSFMYIR